MNDMSVAPRQAFYDEIGAHSLAPLVRKTAPAVVSIATLLPSPAEQNPLLQDPFFRRYFGVPDAALQPAMAAGSGVIVDGAKGLVITNFHVVRNAEAVQVTLKDGRTSSAPAELCCSSASSSRTSIARPRARANGSSVPMQRTAGLLRIRSVR